MTFIFISIHQLSKVRGFSWHFCNTCDVFQSFPSSLTILSLSPFPLLLSPSLLLSFILVFIFYFDLFDCWSVCAYTCMCTLKHMWWSEDNLGCWSSLSVLFESGSFCHSKTHLPGWLPENLWTSPILTSHLTQEHEDYRRVMPHHESAHSCSMYHVTPPTLIFLTKSDISVCRLSTQIRHFKLYGVSFLQQHLRRSTVNIQNYWFICGCQKTTRTNQQEAVKDKTH